ncbi:MarR family winged helix-turn-helix transcriptional regulator [Actinomadura gamaensis]|uniref:MarR family winged helix-turn-helix transcriptional regulator n=1 Tax=Actinomadura gamaensis TaxID=1763541 RepID=A0ABV9U2P8_9ACTN
MDAVTERDDEHTRDDALETIRWELTALARRARAIAGRSHPELSLVAYSLLSHLNDTGGCRAIDLAEYFLLDKSTVSRQVAALERLGLVERAERTGGRGDQASGHGDQAEGDGDRAGGAGDRAGGGGDRVGAGGGGRAGGRGQRLVPTEAGRALLDEAVRRRHEAITERLRDWSDDDLARFAGYLVRYNDAEE